MNVAELIFEVLERLEITTKIGYITSDNASANDTMMTSLADLIPTPWDAVQHRARCLGHCINLTVQAFMSIPDQDAVKYTLSTQLDDVIFSENGYAKHHSLQTLRGFLQWCRDSNSRYRTFKNHP